MSKRNWGRKYRPGEVPVTRCSMGWDVSSGLLTFGEKGRWWQDLLSTPGYEGSHLPAMCKKNCRIIESPRLEKTSKIIQSNHAPTTNISLLNHVPQCHISTALNHLQAWWGDPTTSLGSPCQRLTALLVKKLFLIPNLKPPYASQITVCGFMIFSPLQSTSHILYRSPKLSVKDE